MWLHISLKPQVFLSDCIVSLYWNPKETKWWQVFQGSRVTALWLIFPVSHAHFWEAQRLVEASETTQRCWWRQGWEVRPETRNLEGGLQQEGFKSDRMTVTQFVKSHRLVNAGFQRQWGAREEKAVYFCHSVNQIWLILACEFIQAPWNQLKCFKFPLLN